MREGQLLEAQEIDKMYVLPLIPSHTSINSMISMRSADTSQLSSSKVDTTWSAPYVSASVSWKTWSITFIQVTTAWALKKVFPELTLHIVTDAGHSSREAGIAKLLVQVSHCL